MEGSSSFQVWKPTERAIANPLDMEGVNKPGELLSLPIRDVVSCLFDIEAALDGITGTDASAGKICIDFTDCLPET